MDANEACRVWKYDPETGKFFWRISPRYEILIGDAAGYLSSKYWRLCFRQKQYKASRVAWLMMTGAWPPDQIDHINGDKTDDRFCNLRLATNQQNSFNKTVRKNNKLGVKGVFFDKRLGKYISQYKYNNEKHYLGCFVTLAEAKAAYDNAVQALHGEFART